MNVLTNLHINRENVMNMAQNILYAGIGGGIAAKAIHALDVGFVYNESFLVYAASSASFFAICFIVHKVAKFIFSEEMEWFQKYFSTPTAGLCLLKICTLSQTSPVNMLLLSIFALALPIAMKKFEAHFDIYTGGNYKGVAKVIFPMSTFMLNSVNFF